MRKRQMCDGCIQGKRSDKACYLELEVCDSLGSLGEQILKNLMIIDTCPFFDSKKAVQQHYATGGSSYVKGFSRWDNNLIQEPVKREEGSVKRFLKQRCDVCVRDGRTVKPCYLEMEMCEPFGELKNFKIIDTCPLGIRTSKWTYIQEPALNSLCLEEGKKKEGAYIKVPDGVILVTSEEDKKICAKLELGQEKFYNLEGINTLKQEAANLHQSLNNVYRKMEEMIDRALTSLKSK